MDSHVYVDFAKWLDEVLSNKMPEEIIAYNFNLYEFEGSYHVQLIGASSFSEDMDSDWACDEVFSTGENVFIVDRKVAGQRWKDALAFSRELVTIYLEKGKNNGILKAKQAVAIGFVDGDLVVLHKK